MGYKLAGFNHLGGVEIDPEVADVYKENHKPKYLFVEDIRAFADKKNAAMGCDFLWVQTGSETKLGANKQAVSHGYIRIAIFALNTGVLVTRIQCNHLGHIPAHAGTDIFIFRHTIG